MSEPIHIISMNTESDEVAFLASVRMDRATMIGGTHDGKRTCLDLPVIDMIRVDGVDKAPMLHPDFGDMPVNVFRREIYRKEIIHTTREAFRIYVLDSMSLEEAIRRLLMNYKPNP